MDRPGNALVKESYVRLKDNILYLSNDGKVKVIQVESAVSGEGKTTLICNLAVSLAQNEKRSPALCRRPLVYMVGTTGFEPATFWL